MAGETSPLHDAFHADLIVLAQSRRALLRRPDRRRDPRRQLRLVNQLIRDVKNYLTQRNADPKPYIWRAEGAAILAKKNALA
jgi:hypothetical protein